MFFSTVLVVTDGFLYVRKTHASTSLPLHTASFFLFLFSPASPSLSYPFSHVALDILEEKIIGLAGSREFIYSTLVSEENEGANKGTEPSITKL